MVLEVAQFVNGDFENLSVAAGNYSVLTTLRGWTLFPDVEVRNGLVGAAYSGLNYIELDTFNNSTIIQKFSTDVGTTYNVSFAYSPRIGEAASTNGITVSANGVEFDTVTGQGSNKHEWAIYSYNFVALFTTSSVSFAAAVTSDGLGGSLDAVSVNAVPVPACAALLALGLLGLRARRRSI